MEPLVTFVDGPGEVVATVSADHAESFLARLFVAAGTPDDVAGVAAAHLVLANLSGYDSHGIVHITHYMGQIRAGVMLPSERPVLVSETPSTALIDGRHGWGLYAGEFALDTAIRKARDTGVAAVSVRNCTHIGRLGHYAEIAAGEGLIALITWGAGKPPTWGAPLPGFHLAVPYGGAAPTLSTNPFAMGVPTGDDAPFVLDFATTVIANAKAWILRERGEALPDDAALDRDGEPTTDPSVYMDGGMLRLFGGHKGYAISLLTCLLGALGDDHVDTAHGLDGPFFLVLDPGGFQSRAVYERNVRSFLDGMRQTPPARGFDRVLVPGDVEAEFRERRRRSGIELSASVCAALEAVAAELGVPFDLLSPPATPS